MPIQSPIAAVKKRIKARYLSFLSLEQARRITPKPYLDSIGFELASHCNLHCYSCDHFSQLSKAGYYDLGQFERDCKRLYAISQGLVKSFTLFGGGHCSINNARAILIYCIAFFLHHRFI